MTKRACVGLLTGSGMDGFEGYTHIKKRKQVVAPLGTVDVIEGRVGDVTVYAIKRHGEGHTVSPHAIDSRPHIAAFKQLGVDYIIGISATGAMRKDIPPGTIVVPDGLNRRGGVADVRKATYFNEGAAVHVNLSDPYCTKLLRAAERAVKKNKKLRKKVYCGGTYVNVQGPQFSTREESEERRDIPLTKKLWNKFIDHLAGYVAVNRRKWKYSHPSAIGMTQWAEPALARELEIPYMVIAVVCDWDNLMYDHEVTDNTVKESMVEIQSGLEALVPAIIKVYKPEECKCRHSLQPAIHNRASIIKDTTLLQRVECEQSRDLIESKLT